MKMLQKHQGRRGVQICAWKARLPPTKMADTGSWSVHNGYHLSLVPKYCYDDLIGKCTGLDGTVVILCYVNLFRVMFIGIEWVRIHREFLGDLNDQCLPKSV